MTEPAGNPDPDDVRSLLERAQASDMGALEQLILEHLPLIRAFVRLNIDGPLRAKESCSDLVQSVCRGVLENLDKFEYRGEVSFRGWLYVAVLNKIRSHERRILAAKRDPRAEVALDDSTDPDPDLERAYRSVHTPSHHAIQREELERVEQAFEKLPHRYREIITLSRIVGLSHQQIAERIDSTPSTVGTLLNRAIVRLTRELDRPRRDETG